MFLILGLGNPGDEYANTRHNIGRETVAMLAKKLKIDGFHFEKKWNAEIAEGHIGSKKVILALPNTYMNKSGAAADALARFFKAKPDEIFVVHDDADIMLGCTKLSCGKRSAGHKGVESLMRTLKTRDFWRFRIGISGKKDIPAEKLVLKKFTPDESRSVKKVMKKTADALEEAVIEGPERAMNTYNQN